MLQSLLLILYFLIFNSCSSSEVCLLPPEPSVVLMFHFHVASVWFHLFLQDGRKTTMIQKNMKIGETYNWTRRKMTENWDIKYEM